MTYGNQIGDVINTTVKMGRTSTLSADIAKNITPRADKRSSGITTAAMSERIVLFMFCVIVHYKKIRREQFPAGHESSALLGERVGTVS